MITVIGLGFVGLTTGLGFSKKGFKTYGIDINEERIAKLKNHEIPFFEPHLREVLEETLDKTFFIDVPLDEAVKNSEAIFICVGTPSAEDGSADLSALFEAINKVIEIESRSFKVIIIKSTVPPSTMSKKIKPVVNERSINLERNLGLVSNPEFLREGYCWEDFIEPDRIVAGVEDEESEKIIEKIYKPFNSPIHYVTYNTAEFIKYLSNTLLSTLVSFSNEMSMIAINIGDIDIQSAFRILHQDKRWSGNPASISSYVYPGCGYGGYCLPKDTAAMYRIAKDYGVNPVILGGNLIINKDIKDFIVETIVARILPNSKIGILGLSFKSNSDDVRYAPSKEIIEKLIKKGYNNIVAYDPVAISNFKDSYPEINIEFENDLEVLIEQVEISVILTAWKEFVERKELIFKKMVFDFRYIY